MALTTTQVNQAFLGLLGRPATGAEAAKFAGQLDAATLAQTLLTDASFKNELSVETLSFKTVDLLNTDPAAFVESLYTALLGRASDAEGKAFWLSVAGATPNRADVVAQFIAAVKSQEGTADANAFAAIQAEDKALASAWVESLYNNLAGRASDAEGLDFWTNAIVSFTMTPAQVAASFAAALALQGNTTEDGQNFAAKLGVADNFTANFKDFNSLVTANEKAEQLKNLVTMMNGVNKDSQVDQYTQEITKITDEYQKIAAVQFTAADDDNLGIDPETGESNLKGAANFTGTYNLTDATKGTIQSSDSATGTEAYLTDTLTINVTGYDKTTHDTFNLSELPSTTSIEKLSINNGAATVSGSISGDFEYINVNGTGSFNIDATTSNADGFKDIVLNSAANKDGSNSFATAQNAVSIKAGAGNDNIDLRIDATTAATIAKSLSTGAGKDNVVANIGKDATADLGAGDDTFSGFLGQAAKLNAGAGDDVLAVWGAGARLDSKNNKVAEVEIDGGTGTDTLDLTRGLIDGILGQQNTDYLGVKSIKGIEKMIVGNGTTLYANAISGQKIELSGAAGSNLVLNASGASTIDLTKLSNAKDEDVAVRITNVKNGSISLETGNKNFNAIKETIELSSEATKVSVKGFEKGNDHVAIENATATAEELFTHSITGTTTGINTNLVNANEIFFVSLKEKITKNDLNKLLDTATFSNLTEKDVFYVVATDSAEVYGGTGKNSTAKIYKIEVGKDLKVGKLDQMATVNVADKAQLSAQDFGAGTPTPVPTPTEEVNLSNKTVAADGSVTVLASDFAGYDANAAIKVDLPATATKVNLDGVNVKAVQVSGLQANAEVVIGSGSVIDTLSSTENVALKYTVAAGAKVNTIIGRDLDDTIDTSAVAAGSITGTINGGAGNDTLIISGDGLSNLTSLQSIEKIVVAGTSISAKALSGVTTTLSTNKVGVANLEVKATAADTNINLANLVQDTTDSGSVSLNITGVASNANVTLGAADTLETVNIAGNNNVTVTNAKAGDVLSSTYFAGITGGGANGSFAELGTTIEAGKAYFTSNTTVTDAASAAAALSAQLATITSGNAIVAVNNGANAYVFAVNGAAANKLTLLAKVDNTISADDTINNGVVTFDAGNTPVPPVPTDAYDFIKDLGSPSDIKVGTTPDLKDNVINFKADGSLSVINVDGNLTVKAPDATAANSINIVMASYATDGFSITSVDVANTTLTLAKDTTVSGANTLKNIDTLVINGNTTLNAASIKDLAKSAATISQTASTDTITVSETASFEGIKGSANINFTVTGDTAILTKGTTYTGKVNAILGSAATHSVTLTSNKVLANADSIVVDPDLTTLAIDAKVLKALPTGVKIDLGAATVAVNLTGFASEKAIDLSAYFVNASDDTFTFAAAPAAATTFVGTDGNDTVDFSTNTTITSIDGGLGENAITLKSATKLQSITNVDKITIGNQAPVTLNALALNGSKAEVTISGDTSASNTVTLDAKQAAGTTLDLSGITKAGTNDGIIINDVKAGTIVKLSEFTETVNVAKLGGDVNLRQIASGADTTDKVNVTLATSATKVTGSDGLDTITLSGTYSNLSSINVDATDVIKLDAATTLKNVNAIDGNAFKLDGSNPSLKLTVNAANGVDLSKIVSGDNNAVDIDITGVIDGTVKLSALAEQKETVVLGAKATRVTISTMDKTNDKVDATAVGLTGNKDDNLSDGVAAAAVHVASSSVGDVNAVRQLLTDASASGQSFAANSFVMSTESGDTYKLYKVTEAITEGASGGAIELIATLTSEANGTANVTNGVISFS